MSIKDFLLWQRRSTKAYSQTTPPSSNQGLHVAQTHGFSRRGFIHTAAGATALAFGPGLSLRALAHDGDNHDRTLPAPKPIPGGLNLGGCGGAGAPVRFYSRVSAGPGKHYAAVHRRDAPGSQRRAEHAHRLPRRLCGGLPRRRGEGERRANVQFGDRHPGHGGKVRRRRQDHEARQLCPHMNRPV
jgi:hypothetical protein